MAIIFLKKKQNNNDVTAAKNLLREMVPQTDLLFVQKFGLGGAASIARKDGKNYFVHLFFEASNNQYVLMVKEVVSTSKTLAVYKTFKSNECELAVRAYENKKFEKTA